MAPNKENKRSQDQVKKMSRELNGLMLAHAFMKVRSAGFSFRLSRLDDAPRPRPVDVNPFRLNVEVIDGFVRKTWVG